MKNGKSYTFSTHFLKATVAGCFNGNGFLAIGYQIHAHSLATVVSAYFINVSIKTWR